MSERTRTKAVALVRGGHVALTYVSRHGSSVAGLVRGTGGHVYRVTVDPAGAWCECAYGQHNRGAQCSHTLALQLQAVMDGRLHLVADTATTGGPEQEGA